MAMMAGVNQAGSSVTKIKIILLSNIAIFFMTWFYILTGVSSYLQKNILDLDAHSFGFSMMNALGVTLVLAAVESVVYLLYKNIHSAV